MKDKLIFDTTDAQSIADSDSIGAFLRSSDGTLITHTNVGGNDALDVNISNSSIAVSATNLDIRDLVFATDKVDVSGSEVSLDSATLAALESITVQNGAGAAAVNIQDGGNVISIDDAGGSLTVDGTVAISGTVAVTQSTSPWVVSATDLDIRDLDAAQDSVQSNTHDGAGNAINSTSNALNVYVTGSGALTVNDAALANTAIANEAETLNVANTAQNIVASVLASRKYLLAYNRDNQVMYIGASGVTTSNGFPVSPGSYIELRAGAAVDVEFVSAKVNHEIRTLQLS